MLKKIEEVKQNVFQNKKIQAQNEELLQDFTGAYQSVTIDEPLAVFNEKTLDDKQNNIDYGILKLLEGTWYSYNESTSRKSSGIHTTIMPSPGTNQNQIPGKFVFDCEEYLEQLHFALIPDPVRNRGGATEQFCGAIKYDQSVKSVSKVPNEKGLFPGIHEENGMFLWMSDVMNHEASKESINEDRGVHQWNTDSGKEVLAGNLFPSCTAYVFEKKQLEKELICTDNSISKNRIDELKKLIAPYIEKVTPLVEANPYLDVPFFNVGTLQKPEYVNKEGLKGRTYVSILPAKELKPRDGLNGAHFIPDYSISRSGVIPHGSAITLLGNVTRHANKAIVKKGKPEFSTIGPLAQKVIAILGHKDVSNYSQIEKALAKLTDHSKLEQIAKALGITQTNVISDMSAILKKEEVGNQWDEAHLAIGRTMGGGKNASNNFKKDIPKDLVRPFDLDNPPKQFTKLEDLNSYNDEGENIVYTQRMFMHDLYPYSIRPDFRLRDAIANQNIKQYIHFQLNSKNKTGQQGGILNIPFVNKFVPTVEMNMNMWIEEVEENGKTFLQLQYEQIVFFEFGFGDNGGTTSWPHIQVNTLRKLEDLPIEQKAIICKQFIAPSISEEMKSCIADVLEHSKSTESKCPFNH